MVLPVPNPPGMAAAPPLASGNIVSMTRCPVMSGRGEVSRAALGRGVRMGHFWHRVRVCSPPFSSVTRATGSLTV